MPEDDDDAQILRYKAAYNQGGWPAVIVLADLERDHREKLLVDRVEGYLEQLIVTTGQENPTLTVRDVRARLFDIPQ